MLLKVFGLMCGIARSLSIRLALFYIYVWINCIDFFFDNWFKIRKWSFVSILLHFHPLINFDFLDSGYKGKRILTLNFRKSKLKNKKKLVRLSR